MQRGMILVGRIVLSEGMKRGVRLNLPINKWSQTEAGSTYIEHAENIIERSVVAMAR